MRVIAIVGVGDQDMGAVLAGDGLFHRSVRRLLPDERGPHRETKRCRSSQWQGLRDASQGHILRLGMSKRPKSPLTPTPTLTPASDPALTLTLQQVCQGGRGLRDSREDGTFCPTSTLSL